MHQTCSACRENSLKVTIEIVIYLRYTFCGPSPCIQENSKYYLPWKFRRSSGKIDDSVCHVYIYPITNTSSLQIDFKRVRQREGCLQLLYHLQKCICNLIGQSKGQPIRIDILPGSFLATRYQRMMFLLFLRYIENVGHLKIVKCHVCNCNTNYLNRCQSKVI